MSAYVPVSSTQLFDYSTLVNGDLQNADGTVNSSYGVNSGFWLSAPMHVAPGAHLTWQSPASAPPGGDGLFFGSGGPFPSFEFFADSACTTLIGVDSTALSSAQQNNYTTTVPAGANYARAQFQSNPTYVTNNLQGGTITTDAPLSSSAPTITFSIAAHLTTDPPFTVAASSNSSGALTYSITSGPATISGSTVTLTGTAGTVVVGVAQAAASGYTTGSGSASFAVTVPPTPSGVNLFDPTAVTSGYIDGSGTINAGSGFVVTDFLPIAPGQTLTFQATDHIPPPLGSAQICYYNASKAFVSSGGSFSTASGTGYTVAGSPTTGVSWTAPSTSTIAFCRLSLYNYPAVNATAMIATGAVLAPTYVAFVPPATPTLSFVIPTHYVADAPFTIAATSNSSGAITYSLISGPATLSGSTVTLTGSAGTVVIRASQAAATGFGTATADATFVVSSALAGFTPLVASRFQDAAHNLLTGTLLIQPTDGLDKPITACAGGVGGQIAETPVAIPITNGVLAANTLVPDTSLTLPPNISYRLTLKDSNGAILSVLRGVQPTGGANFNLDTYQPNVLAQAPYTPGDAATVTVGTVTELSAGSTPTVTNSGTASAAVLNFGIPAAAGGSSPLSGKKLAIFGDSISAIFSNQWQNIVSSRTGMVQHFQDARPGRRIDQIFECYGAPSGGSITTNQGSVSTPNGNYANNGTPGDTLAQDLAACDICLIFLGMNDIGVINGGTYLGPAGTATGSLGSLSDNASALTEYGFVRRAIETIQAASPGIRIVLITLYYPSSSAWMSHTAAGQIATAYVQTGADYGCAVVNLLANSGINSFNWSLLLQSDGIHPSTPAGFNRIGSAIAAGLEAVL